MSSPQEQFIELHRRFRELEQTANAEETALASYRRYFRIDRGLGWEDILKRNRVVILGEPGSGKTWEFRNRAKLLNERGEVAFLIRLDRLGAETIDKVLSSEQFRLFKRWKRSPTLATFFLDSVDEAKFHRLSDFYTALDRFRWALDSDAAARARIFLSSRISEWQPRNDAYEFNQRFPAPPLYVRTGDRNNTDEGEMARGLLVVQLDPLNREQVECFAAASGVANVGKFIDALDRNHAWEFARRPLDVSELIEFWKGQGRLGSLTEIIEFDVQLKLRSRAGRDERQLSDAEGRTGAEWLAAASTFSRKFVFNVPDDTPSTGSALDPFRCLPPHWRNEQCRALLGRPLFDSATYGRIQFHHRSVAEFLAAKWLARRVDAGCPIYELEHLLVSNTRGAKVLRPALSPIAAWLCCGTDPWNKSVRAWVLETEPGIHLKYGDPGSLPVDYRRDVLLALSRLSEGRRRMWLESTPECLSRLADPALSALITEFIRDPSLPDDLRIQMLEIAIHGRLATCLDAAIEIVADPGASDRLKAYAVLMIDAIGDEDTRTRLVAIANSMPRITALLSARIATAIFPKVASAVQLVRLLIKTDFEEEHSIDLPVYLNAHFKSAVTPEGAGPLLREILALAQTPPLASYGQENSPVSAQFSWACRMLPTVLGILVKKTALSSQEIDVAAEAAWLLGHFREHHRHQLGGEDFGSLNNSTLQHPEIRRAHFWRLVDEIRKDTKAEPNMYWLLTNPQAILRLAPQDFSWLPDDVSGRSGSSDRLLALRLTLEFWIRRGRSRADRRLILRVIGAQPFLLSTFRKFAASTRFFRLRKFWQRHFRHRIGNPMWWRGNVIELKAWFDSLRAQAGLFRHLRTLASGKPVAALAQLVREADPENTSQFAPITWTGLEKRRGKLIAGAVRRGCKVYWRRFIPELPHEKTDPSKIDYRVIVGLAGIQASIEDGEMNFSSLTEKEAEYAARYAVNELNGFSQWITDLATAHPSSVGHVLSACVEGEWRFPASRQQVNEVLHDLVWQGEALLPLVLGTLLKLLQVGDPPNESILRFALAVLTRQQGPPLKQVAAIAANRVPRLTEPERTALWLTAWMQIEADAAIAALRRKTANSSDADKIFVYLCAMLSGESLERAPIVSNPDYLRPSVLRQFIPLVYSHVRIRDDVDRAGMGVYTPEARDHAQHFRSLLLDRLAKDEPPEAIDVLRELANDPSMPDVRDWILNLLDQRLKRGADLSPWMPSDLRDFAEHHEVDPKNDKELFAIAKKRLLEIRNDVERADNSLRRELRPGDVEPELRKWLQRKLRERSRQRYTVPQEEEIDRQQRPDLRIERPGIGPISIEVKWAENWTLPQLLERLENQLVGQYLRAHDSQYGIYVLGIIRSRDYWVEPNEGKHLTFEEIVGVVAECARNLAKTRSDVSDLEVISIDFREPGRN